MKITSETIIDTQEGGKNCLSWDRIVMTISEKGMQDIKVYLWDNLTYVCQYQSDGSLMEFEKQEAI